MKGVRHTHTWFVTFCTSAYTWVHLKGLQAWAGWLMSCCFCACVGEGAEAAAARASSAAGAGAAGPSNTSSTAAGTKYLYLDFPLDGKGIISVPAGAVISPVFTMWVTLLMLYIGEGWDWKGVGVVGQGARSMWPFSGHEYVGHVKVMPLLQRDAITCSCMYWPPFLWAPVSSLSHPPPHPPTH